MQVGVPSGVGADTGVTEDGQQELISEVVLVKCSGAHWTDPPPSKQPRHLGFGKPGFPKLTGSPDLLLTLAPLRLETLSR